jgi:hypothetical protein
VAKGQRSQKMDGIDKDNFEKLCGIQCTLSEISSFFNCSEDTIEAWVKKEYKQDFSDIFRQKRGKGKISLRRRQWQAAQEGNTALLIFLGKQYLGQADKMESEVNSANGPMVILTLPRNGSEKDGTD